MLHHGQSTRPTQSTIAAENFIATIVSKTDRAAIVMTMFFLIAFSSVVAEQSRRPSASINAGVGAYASSVFWDRSFAVTRLSPL
jgi:hypothetical protein